MVGSALGDDDSVFVGSAIGNSVVVGMAVVETGTIDEIGTDVVGVPVMIAVGGDTVRKGGGVIGVGLNVDTGFTYAGETVGRPPTRVVSSIAVGSELSSISLGAMLEGAIEGDTMVESVLEDAAVGMAETLPTAIVPFPNAADDGA